MAEEDLLSRDEALILLDELTEVLERLDSGELDDQIMEEAERIVESLSQLPLPPEVVEEHVTEMGIWTDLLLEARSEDPEDEERASVVSSQLEDRILRLQGMMDLGVQP